MGGWLVFAATASALAQSTIDGSHCIVFVPGTIHGELARCARLLERDHPLKATTLTLSLGGTAPNHVQSIALSLDGAPAFQNLPVDAAPPITASDVGLVLADMNFDRLVDFGLMTTATGGPQGIYLWFVFQADNKGFMASPGLSALPDPRPDAVSQRIVVLRQRGRPAGVDLYRWQADLLLLDERIERACVDGRCTCRHLRPLRWGFELLRAAACP